MEGLRPPYRSDTGELVWDLERGVVTIDTPFVQAAIGFLGRRTIRLSQMTLRSVTDFAAVGLVSLDGRPIAQSEKLLLTAVSRVKNTDMILKRDVVGFYVLEDWGKAPILVQDVRARIELRLTNPQGARVFRLDEQGQLDTPLAARVEGDRLIFGLGGQRTLWYGIVVPAMD